MGGLNPLYEPSPRLVFPPPPSSGPTIENPFGCLWWANPAGGVSGAVPPQMAPLISGLLGFWLGSIPIRSLPSFTDFSDFLGITF